MIPDLSVLWVIVFVLLLAVVVDRLLFKPLMRVMRGREDAVRSARELAERSAAQAEAATAEFDSKLTAARSEIYRQMDEMRRSALGRRAEILTRTRQEAEEAVAQATARLKADAADASRRLEAEAEALGGAIVERVLGRKASEIEPTRTQNS